MKLKIEDFKTTVEKINSKLRKEIVILLVVATGLIIISQFFYPSDLMLPFSKVDNISVGAKKKTDVIKLLDLKYADRKIPIYFGSMTNPHVSPKPADIGMAISNTARINSMNYPWYFRLLPGSILWMHFVYDKAQPNYKVDSASLGSYLSKTFGETCKIPATNASLKVSGENFVLTKSDNGGICQIESVRKIIVAAKPTLASGYKLNISMTEEKPTITDSEATDLGVSLKSKIKNGVTVSFNQSSLEIPFKTLLSWIEFDNSGDELKYILSSVKASDYLTQNIGTKVNVAAGTSYVSTFNFVETSRVNGASGSSLSISSTLDSIKSFIDGSSDTANAVITTIAPKVIYTRKYSSNDEGLVALIQNFAKDHPGTFGVSLIELDGQMRRASVNETKSFTTASTFKLFVAYSTLRRVEAGSWSWNDSVTSGKNLSTCFDDMIVRSNNACAEALLTKIGFRNITTEAHDIGCKSTSFLGSGGIKTTAADLSLFLAQLKTGQILNQQSSRDRLLEAMSRNVYRSGIPAGLSGLSVADKVGFMDGLLHDAATVTGSTGTYVLVIMTDGSNWSTIADLARQIEALRHE